MARKISRSKKLYRVLRRKWFKPAIYTLVLSYLLYLGISNIVIQKHVAEKTMPQFIITRVTDTFDETEFTHLLLTIQEMRTLPQVTEQVINYINQDDPKAYNLYMEKMLNRMNWAPEAFYSRAQKMFEMYEVYDRIKRMDETISFLSGEVEENRLPEDIVLQLKMIREEKENVTEHDLTPQELNFVRTYAGVIQQLKKEPTAN